MSMTDLSATGTPLIIIKRSRKSMPVHQAEAGHVRRVIEIAVVQTVDMRCARRLGLLFSVADILKWTFEMVFGLGSLVFGL